MEFYVEWQLFATHHRTQYLSAKVDDFLTIKPITFIFEIGVILTIRSNQIHRGKKSKLTFKQVTIELMIVMVHMKPVFFK